MQAVRLIGANDCFGLPPHTDEVCRCRTRSPCCAHKITIPLTAPSHTQSVEVGSRIAIIDLRVFVPEVLSVLSTFARPNFSTHLAQIPFIASLIGRAPTIDPLADLDLSVMVCKDVIVNAIDRSEIDVVRRLPPEQRRGLGEHIAHLTRDANLYGTQLQAFASALASAVRVLSTH